MATIMLVEDDATVLFLSESAIAEHGYSTITAASAEDANALIEVDEPIDGLFTDIDLGTGNGFDVAEFYRTRYPEGAVLYTTGSAVTDGMRARMVADSEIMAKPYRIPELLEILGRLLPGQPADAPVA